MTMSDKSSESSAKYILVAVAWPYANGYLHLGQIAGALWVSDGLRRSTVAAGPDLQRGAHRGETSVSRLQQMVL